MDIQDFTFVPLSDVGAGDIDIINEHKKLIKEEKYSEATEYLNNQNFDKGFRASLFNEIQNKIRKLQLYLLNEFVAAPDEYFSDKEPDEEFVKTNGYTHWLQTY